MKNAIGAYALLSCLSLSGTAASEVPAPLESIEVMVLGTFHMSSTRDTFNPNVEDVLGAERQEELRELTEALARFEPTKVALEATVESPTREEYLLYRKGELELRADERHQIGFRLAGELGHDEVFCVDHYEPIDVQSLLMWAAGNGQGAIAQEAMAAYLRANSAWSSDYMDSSSLSDIFHSFNEDAAATALHSALVLASRIGSEADPVGAEALSKWYGRNGRILGNVLRMAEPGDRILLLYGVTHRRVLEDLIRAAPGFELADPLDYLDAVPAPREEGG